MSALTTSIPPGSWVLVTGTTGFLASHICLQLLERGFKVRGTVRNPGQSSWLLEGRFKPYADVGAIELASVPDLGANGAFDEAIKGVAAIIHSAFITNIVPDPKEVVTPLVNSIRSIIDAAVREPSVKEIVFTASATNTATFLGRDDFGVIGRDTWNYADLEASSAPPPYGMSHLVANYGASKVASEKEVWKLVAEKNLGFNVNVVSPAGLIGEPLHKKHIDGMANWIVHAYRGNNAMMDVRPASFYGDVKDVALVHVAAMLDPEIKNARIQSWGHSTHWNEVLPILRRLRPQRKFVDDYPETYHLKISVDQSESLRLMKKWSGEAKQSDWTPLEDSVTVNINNPYLED